MNRTGGQLAFVVGIVVAACTQEEPERPIGSARLELTEAAGNVPSDPLVAERIVVAIGRQCSGANIPGVSHESCVHRFVITATTGTREVQLTRGLVTDPEDSFEVRVETPAPVTVSLRDGSRIWSTPSGSSAGPGAIDKGAVNTEVATDGRVTFRFDRLLVADTAKVGTVRLSGTIVVDCTPATSDSATCRESVGPARTVD